MFISRWAIGATLLLGIGCTTAANAPASSAPPAASPAPLEPRSTSGTSRESAPTSTSPTLSTPAVEPRDPPVASDLATRGIVVQPVQRCGDAAGMFVKGGSDGELVAIAACLRGSDDQLRRVRDGATVYPGDELSFTVQSTRAAHLQLFQWQHGVLQRLWPPDETTQSFVVKPNQDLVVPTSGYRFVLDRNVGPITLFVVSSIQPLDRTDAVLYQTARLASKKAGLQSRIEPSERRRKSLVDKANAGPSSVKPEASLGARATGSKPVSPTSAGSPERAVTESALQAAPPSTRGGFEERGVVVERDAGFVVAKPDLKGLALIEFHLNHVLQQ